MEELNNRQMILLSMFASFVISIATAIITVAMLQVAPETVTQTVNRVMEHTIERIVTGTTTNSQAGTSITNITKEVTVYAREDDLVVAAVEKNQPRIVQLFAPGTASSSDPQAVGFVVSRDGLIATERKNITGDSLPLESYTAKLGDRFYTATVLANQSKEKQVVFLKLEGLTASSTIDAVTYGRNENPKVAQTVVILGGSDGSSVAKATIAKMQYQKSDATTTPQQLLIGMTTNPKIPPQNLGGLVVNLDGQAVGMVITDQTDNEKFLIYPIARILELVVGLPSKSSDNQDVEKVGG